LSISDTALGMFLPAFKQRGDRKPFFTTTAARSRYCLGLSMVYGFRCKQSERANLDISLEEGPGHQISISILRVTREMVLGQSLQTSNLDGTGHQNRAQVRGVVRGAKSVMSQGMGGGDATGHDCTVLEKGR